MVNPNTQLVSWSLTSLLQHKYGYIKDEPEHTSTKSKPKARYTLPVLTGTC